MIQRPPLLIASILCLLSASTAARAEITAERTEAGVTIKIDGKLFTKYVTQSNNKPILYPVIGPTGKAVTRNYPMTAATAGERADHPHHRSFWFTHGDVNGVSFWHENPGAGSIVHRKFVKVSGGKRAVIVTQNDWIDAKGKKQCEDVRTLTFFADGDTRTIDFEITLKATAGDVKLGDTKEGCFGIRVAGDMKPDSKKGGKLINSEGQVDKNAWGKAAAWVDYHGPVEGERLGIAIMNHPSSFRYPTYWHVRTYGLFAANPFGLHHFKGSNQVDGSHTIPSGKSITLRYRVLLHKGDHKAGKVAESFAAYAKESKGVK